MKKVIAVVSVVMMLVFSSVSVMAATSPVADDYFTITMGTSSSATSADVEGGTITVSANPVVVGEEITLTADSKDGYAFSKWIITGEYTIVSGSLTDDTLTIIPEEDITVDGEFTGSGDETTKKSDDTSSTSPQTGESAALVVIALLAACGVTAIAKKRIAE